MISMVRINVLVCWYILLCVANITSRYYANSMLFVLAEIVCILKYKLNILSLSNTWTVFIFTNPACKH